MKIASLVSGGVDSSVTIPLIKDMGYDPHIFYIEVGLKDDPNWIDCPTEEDLEIVTYIAKKYGCKMEIVSLQDDYWEMVISYTINAVKNGLTPNPDIMCNKFIKFGAFNEKYGSSFDLITTGHYANILTIDHEKYLGTAKDTFKDQTYFLGQITKNQLDKLMFPIGHLLKEEVRQKAIAEKLPSAYRKDSQGICFLGKINYSDFIKRYVGEKPGKIIELETKKVLGTHKGLWFHTIGQRKGLGLGQGPWFVVKKDIEDNIIWVSNGYDPIAQYKEIIELADFHFLNDKPDRNYLEAQSVKFKIRHQPTYEEGTLINTGNSFLINSKVPISGVAPGQYGVIYNTDATICLGSGVIC